MAAYCLFDNLQVHDPAKLEEYKKSVFPIVEKYQGKYVVVGGNTEVIEGVWDVKYLVMLEFPSLDHARKWYHSPDYAELKKLRLSAVEGKALIIEGIQDLE